MEKVRKQKSFDQSYRSVVLWSEDLAEIMSLLSEKAKDVRLSTDDYIFKTVEEAKEHFGSQVQFAMEITSSSPFVRLEFSRMAVRLHVSSGPQSAQLFHDINAVLVRRQRSAFYSWWWLVPIVLAGVASRFFPEQENAITVAQLVCTAWYLWVLFVTLRRTSVITLQRRSEARPFFERNKDQLILLLIGGVVGGLITFAGVVVKERFYPSAPSVNVTKPP